MLLVFFLESVSPKPLIIPLGSFQIYRQFATGVADAGGKFATGVVDTGGNFAAGVADTGSKFATDVVDTGGAP